MYNKLAVRRALARTIRVTAVLACLVFFPSLVQAEDTPDRPRIGIALGGGGARGAAHIGVLQALEELCVPVDYVSGTSMGSIVGALYCLGLSPSAIEDEILAIDWDDLFADRPHRAQRHFRRKQDDSSFFLPLEFGFKNRRVVFSSGIIAGQKLGFALPLPGLYLAGYQGFDNLPFPFRPVATDLATGQMFVMDRGNLLKAVRASMSIPGIFPPVEWDGHFLVDGFLVRNLPVDVVRDMGADVVIAVDVGNNPQDTDPDKFQTLLGVAEQTGIIQARQNVEEQLPLADILIKVELPDISSRDFKLVDQTIPLGKQAALAVADQLSRLALSPAEYQEHRRRHQLEPVEPVVVDQIVLANHSPVDDRSIRRQIHQKIGEPLDLDLLKKDLGQIFDFGVFELVDFELTRDAGQQTTLKIIANDKYYFPNILNFGLTYSGGSEGRSYLDARLRITRLEINRWGSEWRTDLQLGRSNGARTEYYQPLTWTRRPFVAASLQWQKHYQDWYVQGLNLGDFKKEDVTGTVDLGYRLGHAGEIRLGLEYGHLRAGDQSGLDLYKFSGPRGGQRVILNLDLLDAPVFPTSGYRLRSRFFQASPAFGSGLDYRKADLAMAGYFSRSGQTFSLGLQGGSSLGTELPEFDKFVAGGPGGLEGYRPDQLRGQILALASVSWYTRVKGQPSPFSTSWYVGAKLEMGNVWRNAEAASWHDLRHSGSVSLILNTLAGPLAATYSRTEDGADAFSLSLGHLLPFFD